MEMTIHGEAREADGEAINLAPSKPYTTSEFRVVAMRECVTREDLRDVCSPEKAAAYWREVVSQSPELRTEQECFVVLFLNSRRRVKGFQIVSTGTLDTLLVSPSIAFRAAIIAAAAAIIVMHNHPSGDPTPSEADIKVTRDLIRAGQLLKVELLDHVVMGLPKEIGGQDYTSLRELGYFYGNS